MNSVGSTHNERVGAAAYHFARQGMHWWNFWYQCNAETGAAVSLVDPHLDRNSAGKMAKSGTCITSQVRARCGASVGHRFRLGYASIETHTFPWRIKWNLLKWIFNSLLTNKTYIVDINKYDTVNLNFTCWGKQCTNSHITSLLNCILSALSLYINARQILDANIIHTI